MSRAPSDGSTSICNQPPYVFSPPLPAERTAAAFLSLYPIAPSLFSSLLLSPFPLELPPVSTSTLILDFCLHPQFVHAFSYCSPLSSLLLSLSLFPPPFPEVFTKLFNFPVDSSRVFRCLVPSKALQRAGGNRKSRVLLKGGNALFKCSPREHTEDKTAPRRRIRRVNRHLLFLPFSFPSLVSSTAVTGGAAIFSLQLLGEERSCSTFFLFFCICCCATRKETIFHTFHR